MMSSNFFCVNIIFERSLRAGFPLQVLAAVKLDSKSKFGAAVGFPLQSLTQIQSFKEKISNRVKLRKGLSNGVGAHDASGCCGIATCESPTPTGFKTMKKMTNGDAPKHKK